jgi:hypothetical protein
MFDIKIDAQSANSDEQKIFRALKALSSHEVLVGIPSDKAKRKTEDEKGGPINNAELLYIHTNGDPRHHIPARPVIEPAVEDDKEVIGEIFADAFSAALEGDEGRAMNLLEQAGIEGASASQKWFTNSKNGWAPNAESTVKRKKSNRPLIDTGQLRRSITYAVRGKS